MEIQQQWQDLLDAWLGLDWPKVKESAASIVDRLERGDVAPNPLPVLQMGDPWNRVVVLAACQHMKHMAEQVLVAPNGIPPDVPFSLSCCECDADGVDSFEQAIAEGWTSIDFYPQGAGENFIGLCPEHRDEE